MIRTAWIAVCFLLSSCARASSLDPQTRLSISYELIEMNAACSDLDSCHANRNTDDLRVVNCQCRPICVQLGTCCLDSEFSSLPVEEEASRIAPVKLFNSPHVVFMVIECKPDWRGDSTIKDLCRITKNSAYADPFLLAPVTNPRTGVTYKNYYCFVCNEEDSTDTPVVWEFQLFSAHNFSLAPNPKLYFNRGASSYRTKGRMVFASIAAPQEVQFQVNWYRQNVIGDCAVGWPDIETKEKCEAYTAIVYAKHPNRAPVFRNPHCAICNDVDVSELVCSDPTGNEVWGGPPYGYLFVGLFTIEDKVSRCPANQVFDRYSNKCRAVRCGRNQRIVEGACVNKEPIITSGGITTSTPSILQETPSSTTVGLPNTPLPTGVSTTTPNPRPGHQGGSQLTSGPRPYTGRNRPLPKNATSTGSNSTQSILIYNYPKRPPLRHVITYEYNSTLSF